MAELGPDIAEQIVAACQAGTDEIAEALSRTFDTPIKVEVGQPDPFNLEAPPDGWDGPGLAIMLAVGDKAALVFLAEASGLVPAWYENPDPTGVSKLTTLAQELGMLVLPEDLMPDDFRAGRVENLREAMVRAKLADDPRQVPLQLTAESGSSGALYVVWTATDAGQVFVVPGPSADSPPAETAAESAMAPPSQPSPQPAAPPPASPKPAPAAKPAARKEPVYENLPNYALSLLRTKVPVAVTLASQKQPVSRIIELGPGSIIQFDKACEEMLSLEVGGQTIAEGEAVKVGEKFGIRLTSLKLPEERFHAIQFPNESQAG